LALGHLGVAVEEFIRATGTTQPRASIPPSQVQIPPTPVPPPPAIAASARPTPIPPIHVPHIDLELTGAHLHEDEEQ